MTLYSFYHTATDFRDAYIHLKHSYQELNREQEIRLALLKDIIAKTKDIKLPDGKSVLNEPISQIKLNGNYSRKLVVQVFSAFGLKVTRYTREYGKTIVHFEDASDSP